MSPPGVSYLQSFNIHITGSHSWSQISLKILNLIALNAISPKNTAIALFTKAQSQSSVYTYMCIRCFEQNNNCYPNSFSLCGLYYLSSSKRVMKQNAGVQHK